MIQYVCYFIIDIHDALSSVGSIKDFACRCTPRYTHLEHYTLSNQKSTTPRSLANGRHGLTIEWRAGAGGRWGPGRRAATSVDRPVYRRRYVYAPSRTSLRRTHSSFYKLDVVSDIVTYISLYPLIASRRTE